MNRRCVLFGALGLTGLAVPAGAADWPGWRGPERTGLSEEKGLLKEWPAAGPTQLWQATDLGGGYSTPSVAGPRLYVLGNQGLENESIEARKVSDGSRVWPVRLGKVGNPDQTPAYPGSRSTPTVDRENVHALGSDGNLVCLEAASGKEVWRKNLRTDFGGSPGKWAYSESPLIDGDLLICTPGGADATLVALNKRTGALVWKSAIPGADDAAYASPIISRAGGVKQYVQFLSKGVVGVDAATGKFLWRYDKTAQNSPANMPTPVAYQDYVYNATGRVGGALLRIKGGQGTMEVEEVYPPAKLPNAIGGAVRVGDYLYGTTTGGMMCVVFATGEVKWNERGVGIGSVCYADGNLYVHGENGQVALVEATPEAYREKGRFTPANGPERGRGVQAWTYPVVANGRLYIRDLNSLWCYDIQAK